MKVLERGHIYELENKKSGIQILSFFKDLPKGGENHDGVLCQEVLRALIDRVIELWTQQPCQESTEILMKLRECLVLFESRAARQSLNKCYASTGLNIEELPTLINGHVFSLEKSL